MNTCSQQIWCLAMHNNCELSLRTIPWMYRRDGAGKHWQNWLHNSKLFTHLVTVWKKNCKPTYIKRSNIPIYIISDVTKATGHDFSFTPNCAIYARLGPSDTSWNIICIYRYYSLCLDENFAPIISEFKRCRWRWCRANSHKKIFLKENLTNFFYIIINQQLHYD